MIRSKLKSYQIKRNTHLSTRLWWAMIFAVLGSIFAIWTIGPLIENTDIHGPAMLSLVITIFSITILCFIPTIDAMIIEKKQRKNVNDYYKLLEKERRQKELQNLLYPNLQLRRSPYLNQTKQARNIDMQTTYKSCYIPTSDLKLAWFAMRARHEATGATGSETLYMKKSFVIDNERILTTEEASMGGDMNIESNLPVDNDFVTALRTVNPLGQTVGWLFAGKIHN